MTNQAKNPVMGTVAVTRQEQLRVSSWTNRLHQTCRPVNQLEHVCVEKCPLTTRHIAGRSGDSCREKTLGKARPWQDAVSTAAGTSADHTRELRLLSQSFGGSATAFSRSRAAGRLSRKAPTKRSQNSETWGRPRAREKKKQSTEHVKGSSVWK